MVMDFSNDSNKNEVFYLEFVRIVCVDKGSINMLLDRFSEFLCVRYCKCSSLAVKIYAHLISIGIAMNMANQTVLYILWKSIFYGRLSSSFGVCKAIAMKMKRIHRERITDCCCYDSVFCVSMPFAAVRLVVVLLQKVVRHYYGS